VQHEQRLEPCRTEQRKVSGRINSRHRGHGAVVAQQLEQRAGELEMQLYSYEKLSQLLYSCSHPLPARSSGSAVASQARTAPTALPLAYSTTDWLKRLTEGLPVGHEVLATEDDCQVDGER
jgi:hypothetical protein